jgi:hypothetical protein
VPPNAYCVGVIGVADFSLRGFRVDAAKVLCQVFVTGSSPGTVLENLDFVGSENVDCIEINALPLSVQDAPLRIQKCTLRNRSGAGIYVIARKNSPPWNEPRLCANVVICNNDFIEVAKEAVALIGAVQRNLVVGNRIVHCGSGIELIDFLPEAENVVVANNTVFAGLNTALGVWDEKKAALRCKNIRFQNNLVLSPNRNADLVFYDHQWGVHNGGEQPGDTAELLKAWRFSHNWREISEPKSGEANAKFWIPAGPKDMLKKPIEVLSREPADADFLRPPKHSTLAEVGAGLSDKALPLPSYVGAVPPEGVEAWDWSVTWKALAR